jgi:hypothetical protein
MLCLLDTSECGREVSLLCHQHALKANAEPPILVIAGLLEIQATYRVW